MTGKVTTFGRGRGFTLVELLVSMAILTLICILLVRIIGGVSQTTNVVGQQLDSVQAARRALDALAEDIENSVVGNGSSIIVNTDTNNPLVAMLTRGRGPKPTNSTIADNRLLAVNYSLDASNADRPFRRGFENLNWSTVDFPTAIVTSASNLSTSNPSVLATGILGFNVTLILEDGTRVLATTATTAGWATTNLDDRPIPANYHALVSPSMLGTAASKPRVRSVEVTLAAIDERNLRLLIQTGKISNVTLNSDVDASTKWIIAADSFANLPAPARSAIRILTKIVEMP